MAIQKKRTKKKQVARKRTIRPVGTKVVNLKAVARKPRDCFDICRRLEIDRQTSTGRAGRFGKLIVIV